MKFWKNCPLFLMLLFSGCLIGAVGHAGADSIYSDYRSETAIATGISSVFMGWKDGIYPWTIANQEQEKPQSGEPSVDPSGESADIDSETGTEIETETDTEAAASEKTGNAEAEDNKAELIVPAESHSPEYDKFGVLISDEIVSIDTAEIEDTQLTEQGDAAEAGIPEEDVEIRLPEEAEIISVSENEMPESEFPEMDELIEENRTYEFTAVGEDYFNDALFIGDSRTVGLASYAGFPEETDFWAVTSTTIHQIFEKPKKIAELDDGRKVTVEEALREKQYGKIYIMLGINELGRGTTGSFFTTYAEAVNQIRLLQPNAVIFIQGIMRVSSEKSGTDPVFNNERINERNSALSMMANQQDIFYLEINDAVCDETGGLVSAYTYDQIHLKAKYYQLWKDYLLLHGIVRE